jgi:glycosyltransferase involved in cell wall biosynthesis
MSNEKASIIVPVYNTEKYLRQCLDSILNQTYQNLEILLVDDGSPDRSGAICDEYAAKDPRIRVIHTENRGVSAARNTAMQAVSGEYIIFVDSDDYVAAEYVENLMAGADADLVTAGLHVQTPENRWDEWKNPARLIVMADVRKNPPLFNAIPTGMVYSHRYKRKIVQHHQLRFHEDITRTEDTLFNMEYLMVCDTVLTTDHTDYFYRYTGTSATTKLHPNLFRWSLKSLLLTGQIIGTDNDTFCGRAWNNAMNVCDNYFRVTKNAPWSTKRKAFSALFEVCSNPYTRKGIPYAKKHGQSKKAHLVQFYLYPFLPVIYRIYSGFRKLLG